MVGRPNRRDPPDPAIAIETKSSHIESNMNVFEDLVIELKEENLLEETVIDQPLAIETKNSHIESNMNVFEDLVIELKEENLLEETVIDRSVPTANGNGNSRPISTFDSAVRDLIDEVPKFEVPGAAAVDSALEFDDAPAYTPALNPENIRQGIGDRMSALQLVDHVFAAVEANLNGAKSGLFDDLTVKKAFHRFAQASAAPDSNEYFEAESAVLAGIGMWEETLQMRDGQIPADAIRRYAEAANPPLSPQALFALARFYRNADFSRQTLAKFDFVVTRLFSKFVDGEKRDLLCSREEIRRHLNQRYDDWSGGSFRPVAADDPDIVRLVLGFDKMAAEASKAADLDELISNRLFDRLCELKENAGELFLAPEVSSVAVDCNVRIASKVIDLVSTELKRSEGRAILAKYENLDESNVSNAIGRTFELEFMIAGKSFKEFAAARQARTDSKSKSVMFEEPKPRSTRSWAKKPSGKSKKSALFGVNRWLLLATVLTVIVSVGIYLWAEYFAGDAVTSNGVKVVDLEKPELKELIKTSKVSGTILYAVVTPAFEKLSAEQQREFLQKLKQIGVEKGFNKVSLINSQGKTVGYASEARVELTSQ